jgi:hypothetical protein
MENRGNRELANDAKNPDGRGMFGRGIRLQILFPSSIRKRALSDFLVDRAGGGGRQNVAM